VLSEDSDTDAVLVQFPLPTPAVEDVPDNLNAAGLEDMYTVVTSAETVETRNFENIEDRYAEREGKDIAPAELRTRALEMGQERVIYYTMTLLSAVVAAAGPLLDAPAVVAIAARDRMLSSPFPDRVDTTWCERVDGPNAHGHISRARSLSVAAVSRGAVIP